jgi:hypothetical protein
MKRLIPIPREHVDILRRHRETGMGYHVVSVTLKNGKHFEQVVTSEGYVIQVRGHKDVPFSSDDVAAIDVNHKTWNFREQSRFGMSYPA